MKRSFFLTLFSAVLSVLVLMVGRYAWFSLRAPIDHSNSISMDIIRTTAVSRSTVDRENEDVLHDIASSGHESTLNDDGLVHKEDTDLQLLTFNIRHGVNEKGEDSIDSIIQSIKETGAEIIALQEVDSFMPRSGFKNQAKEIAEALDYDYVYGETINLLGIKYGNAILSAYPIVEYENKKLYSKKIETRSLLKAVIDVNGTLYNVYNTHLGLNSEERIKQIEQINETIEEDDGYTILMGDFNEDLNSKTMEGISKTLMDSVEQSNYGGVEQYTYAFYSDKPNTRIDRIYVDRNIEIQDHYVKDAETSDHCMVITIISCIDQGNEGIITFIENE